MAADLMAPVAWLLPWVAMLPTASFVQPPPPPPEPPAQQRSRPLSPPAGVMREGRRLRINGVVQQARWQLIGEPGAPQALWLPLEVLQNQLGVDTRSSSDGSLRLEWFGHVEVVPTDRQKSLDDEVSVDSLALLQAAGMKTAVLAGDLTLDLPPTRLLSVRSSRTGNQRRVVLDLAGPALMRREGTALWLGIDANPAQRVDISGLGLAPRAAAGGLQLNTAVPAQRLFSLGEPARIVIDLETAAAAPQRPSADAEPPVQPQQDPRLQALLGRELLWERQVRGGVLLNAVRIDPRNRTLLLRPLTRSSGMEGLSSLQQLAAADDALVAINGGYFNRVRRLPLGAVKADGRWLSGPILGRGVVAWTEGSMPRFGRLSLTEWLNDGQGQRIPVVVLNSGYVQRGLSRYTADWGPTYRALSGEESALVLRNGTVQTTYIHEQLEQGVPLRPGETLIVARGGSVLPWDVGDGLSLSSQPSHDLGLLPNVIGGGPLLLQGGRIVLNGAQESFSSGFLRQGAPRTVIASDGRQLWLITLEGSGDAGPSLAETATLLQQMGLQDALNLDGGSSTGLVMGGVMTVKGRGVAGAVHHGLGLVLQDRGTSAAGLGRNGRRQPAARVRSDLASTPGIQP